jgi:mRNA-degrading endonuclease YafQ of YafQ-DinJ toxin-antitoxin module
MLEVKYTPHFIRMFNALSTDLQDEILERIEDFKDPQNHSRLRVHPLKCRLKGRWSFSVNYDFRVVFEYKNRKSVAECWAVGNHDIYK